MASLVPGTNQIWMGNCTRDLENFPYLGTVNRECTQEFPNLMEVAKIDAFVLEWYIFIGIHPFPMIHVLWQMNWFSFEILDQKDDWPCGWIQHSHRVVTSNGGDPKKWP